MPLPPSFSPPLCLSLVCYSASDSMGDSNSFSPLPSDFSSQLTEEEIILHFLHSRHQNLPSFPTVFLNSLQSLDRSLYDPSNLPDSAYFLFPNEHRWYFLSPKLRRNRLEELRRDGLGGYWKKDDSDQKIMSRTESSVFGVKKTFVFYRGSLPFSQRTNWFMEEFDLSQDAVDSSNDSFVLCRVFLRCEKENNAPHSATSVIHDVELALGQHAGASVDPTGEVVEDELDRLLMEVIDDLEDAPAAEPVDGAILHPDDLMRNKGRRGPHMYRATVFDQIDASDVTNEIMNVDNAIIQGSFLELNDLQGDFLELDDLL